MTRTIKLVNGGISFKNGILEMVGQENQISVEEVKQRVGIRFATQTGMNPLHPTEGFNLWGLMNLRRNNSSISSSIEEIAKCLIKSTMQQDPDVVPDSMEIYVIQGAERNYIAGVKYSIKGAYEHDQTYGGNLGVI